MHINKQDSVTQSNLPGAGAVIWSWKPTIFDASYLLWRWSAANHSLQQAGEAFLVAYGWFLFSQSWLLQTCRQPNIL